MRRVHRLAVFAILLLASFADANVLHVDRNATGSVHDGTSWPAAYTRVTDALRAATSGDEVWVARATYAETITPPAGVAVYGGFAGIESERSQRDWHANVTVLDGGQGRAVSTRYQLTVVDGFTILNGSYGVSLSGASTLSNNIITSKGSETVNVYGTATLSNNTITGPVGIDVRGTAIISGNTIVGNTYWGVIVDGGTATLSNNTISRNGMDGVLVSGTATLSNNTITSNGYTGVFVQGGTARLANNIIAFNSHNGAGTLFSPGMIAVFSHNDVYGNTRGDFRDFIPPDDQANISMDPKLSNIYHDVHIQPDSPCRDAGDDAAVLGTVDIDGQPRGQGTNVDIGSDESNGEAWAVPSMTWHVSTAGDDANDGLSWVTAKRTVGGALAAARGTDEVWVAKGTYAEHVEPPAGVGLYGGFAGTEAERGQRNWHVNSTVLDGYAGTVVRCTSYGIVLDGFTVRNGSDGVSLNGGTVTLANNYIRENSGSGVYVNRGTTVNTNNVISSNGSAGIAVYDGQTTLFNNTVCGNSGDGVIVNTMGVYGASPAVLANNIVSFNGGKGVSGQGTGIIVSCSHNDVVGNNTGDYSGYTPPDDQGNISQDPLFVDRGIKDYHLLPDSPCRDAGDSSVKVPGGTDLDGEPRIVGSSVDMGAYEFGTPSPQPFALEDVRDALGIAAGMTTATPEAGIRLNVESDDPAVTICDAVRIARKIVHRD